MKTLLFVLLTTFSFGQNNCLQLDVMLVADLSGSVQGSEHFISDAMTSFVNQFELSEETIKIGIVVFNTEPELLSPLTSDKLFLLDRITKIPNGNNETYMSSALFTAFSELMSGNGRPGYRKIIILISDGMPTEPYPTKLVSKQIKEANVIICGILINEDFEFGDQFMRDISTNESYYVKSDYKSLANQIKKLDICF